MTSDANLRPGSEGTFRLLNARAGPWLAQFVECAKARQSALKEVKVKLHASVQRAITNGHLDFVEVIYCLDRLENARQQAEHMGITISYEDGPTKQDYQAYCERLQSGEEEIDDPYENYPDYLQYGEIV